MTAFQDDHKGGHAMSNRKKQVVASALVLAVSLSVLSGCASKKRTKARQVEVQIRKQAQ